MMAIKWMQLILRTILWISLFVLLIGGSAPLSAHMSVDETQPISTTDRPAATWATSTDVSGNITADTTWTLANSPYRVTGSVTVNAGVTLTIQPGVQVIFNQFTGLWVYGTLSAVGTVASPPIVFTGSTAQAGWWRGIYVQDAGSVTLTYAQISYAGYWDSMGVWKRGSGALSVQHSTIRNVSGDGLRIAAGYSSFTSAHNNFSYANYGVRVGIGVSFNDDTSTFANNNINVYLDGGSISQQVTWNLHPNYSFFVSSNVTVAEGGRLDILPDTVVKFAQFHGLYVNGTLNAIGMDAAIRPITFTDWRDDTVGGDANKDGSATAPAANWWRGLYVQNAGTATLTHVTIRYTGYWDSIGLRKGGSGSLTLTDTVIQHGRGYGLHVWDNSGLVTLTRVTLENQTDSGLRLANAGTVNGSGGYFRNNGQYGIQQDVNDSFGYTGSSFSGNGLAGVGINGGARAGDMLLSPAGNPFRVMGNVTVAEGATLTVEAGARIEFAQFAGLYVNGNLQAVSTGAAPIILTGSTAQNQWWRGIYVQNAGSATLAHIDLAYAGYWDTAGILKSGSGGLDLQNSTIRNVPAGDGLRIAAGYSSFTSAGNHFAGHNYGVRLGINASFDDKTSTFADNNKDLYVDGGTIDRAVTWNLHPDYSFFVSANVTVGEAGRLEILPDTVVKFAQFSGIWVNGELVTGSPDPARAPSAAPVYLTDLRDDTVGGDTNDDGNATAPATNWWRGIYVQNAGTATLINTHLRYTGYWDGIGIRKSGTGTLTMSNSTIRHSRQFGLDVTNNTGQVTLGNVTLAENGGAGMNLANAGPVTGTNCTFQGNVLYGLLQGTGDTFGYEGNLFTGNGQAGVAIIGYNRSTDMRLSPAGNPFLVLSGLQIEDGATLTVEAGTQIRFSRFYGLTINGDLHAVATGLSPITFTGDGAEAGWWRGIYVQNAGSANLSHVEISYAGYWDSMGLIKSGSGYLILRNSTIRNTNGDGLRLNNSTGHHDITRNLFTANGTGVLVQNQAETLFLVNNLIEANTNFGVRNANSATVYARYNWWGHAGGPQHATVNPNGQGNPVSNGVLFYPWNETRTVDVIVPPEVLVSSHGPSTISPGQTVNYGISYRSLMPGPVTDAALVVQLPAAADYLAGSGGVYWPERHQVFWLLGNIPPDGQGSHLVEVRYRWGLPDEYSDGVIALLGGGGFNPAQLDVTPYKGYVPVQIAGTASLSDAQVQSALAGNAALRGLFDAALADGFVYGNQGGLLITPNVGDPTLQITLVQPDRSAMRYVRRTGTQAHALTYARNGFTLQDSSGGVHIPVDTQEPAFFGDWDEEVASRMVAGCSEGRCFWNCALLKAVECGVGLDKALGVLSMSACVHPSSPECLEALKNLSLDAAGVPCIAGVIDCKSDCKKNPNSHCCTGNEVLVTPSRSGIIASFGDYLGREACSYRNCNATTGTWDPAAAGRTILCAKGERCVARRMPSGQPICKPCGGDFLSVTATDVCALESGATCGFSIVRRARDPNEKFGPAGDLLPGQTVTYTITYENEGAGTAYGVYVTDELSEVFDEGSLAIHNGGRYIPEIRTLVWDVGELTPKGQAGSTGSISFSVRLRNGLPSGTPVINEATVYFPSVPEVTPTGAVVNLIQPVTALPQALATDYRTAIAVTLRGKEVSGLPLTYKIVEQPRGGTLTGTAPNLTYTPAQNFTGPDSFTFTVNNGTSTSRAAQVWIEVKAVGDTTSPQVLWTIPAANATGVAASITPVFTDTVGPLYGPAILIGMSEALNPATANGTTVTLARSGAAVASSVTFDAGSNRIVLRPRAVLTAGAYTVTVTTGVTDLAGNGPASPYVLRFSVGEESEQRIYLPAVQK